MEDLPTDLNNPAIVKYGLVASVLLVYGFIQWLRPSKASLPDIPAVGYTIPPFSYFSAIKYAMRGQDMVQEGYNKHKGRVFKVPELFQWHAIVTGPKLIEELRKAGDDVLSFNEGAADLLQVDYTLGPAVHHNPYHVPLVRNQLTRSIGNLFPEMKDEMQVAFSEVIPLTNDWKPIPAVDSIMQIVCRMSNRVFVGLSKCRDPDFIALNIEFTISVMKSAAILRLFPWFVRPLAARVFTKVPTNIAQAVRHLEDIIKQRYRLMEMYGKDYSGKPNDILSWFMDEAKGEERNARALALRILMVNFASVHTTSLAFAHALFHLAANPEFLQPMREEVDKVIREEGWTKSAIGRMNKVDSFLREANRFNGLGALTMTRKALQDYTFSDGTFIPKGGFVSAAEMPTHYDNENYDHPEIFNPWRFVELASSAGADDASNLRYQMVSTSASYVTFGHGKNACPGRFFAAHELKAMMAYLVMHYDVKMEQEGVIPERMWFATKLLPCPIAEVLFRKRTKEES